MGKVCVGILSRGGFTGAISRDNFGWTALHRGARMGSFEACKQLLAHPRFTAVNGRAGRQCWTALHLAAMHGHADVCELLVKTPECDQCAVDHGGRTALHTVVRHRQEEACKTLLSSDCYGLKAMAIHDNWYRTCTDAARLDAGNSCAPILQTAQEKLRKGEKVYFGPKVQDEVSEVGSVSAQSVDVTVKATRSTKGASKENSPRNPSPRP